PDPPPPTSSTLTRNRTWRTMPRVAGLSATSTVCPIRFSPRARIVARLRAMWLIVLLIWVTRSLSAIAGLHRHRGRLAGDVADETDAAARAQLLGRVQAAERLDRGPGHVDRVRRAVGLGQDVADAGRLDDGADRATGDDARTLRGRLQHDARGREDLADLVGDRRPDHRDPDQVLLRVLHALADGLGHLAGLAEPGADVARAVADDDDRGEAEAPAALDDLRHAVDLDDALLERELVGVDACHVSSSRSEVETGFSGGIGERLDPPVVPEPGSIEDDALDTGGLRPLGDQEADDGRLIGLRLTGAAELLLDGRRGGERLARAV